MANYDARQFASELIEIIKTTPKEELDKLSIDQIIKIAQKKIEEKTPQALEVQVGETVQVIDKMLDAITYIMKIIQEWIFSNKKEPLTISIRKPEARGPPSVLGINVGDSQTTKDRMK